MTAPSARISLALVLHNHQPVGNFGWVIAESYDKAYLPMVEALERHPSILMGLHYSGPLLDWLRAERPEFLDRLSALVGRGQVELLGGGYYEPVLASLPERDRIGQLERMSTPATAGRSSTTPTSGRPRSTTTSSGGRTSPRIRDACWPCSGPTNGSAMGSHSVSSTM